MMYQHPRRQLHAIVGSSNGQFQWSHNPLNRYLERGLRAGGHGVPLSGFRLVVEGGKRRIDEFFDSNSIS